MYNNPNQYPYLIQPNHNDRFIPPQNAPNNNGYHTTNVIPPTNPAQFTPIMPLYPSNPMNTTPMQPIPPLFNAYNTTNIPPNPQHTFPTNIYTPQPNVGPPQFVTIVNKATNYITSSPYPLLSPQTQTMIPPPSPSSDASSKTDNNTYNLDMDEMLKHFHFETENGSQLWEQCFQNISYHNLTVNHSKKQTRAKGMEQKREMQNIKEEITVPVCDKCVDKNNINMTSNTAHTPVHTNDSYHKSSFHFIFAIQGLGVFEYCKHCFTQSQTETENENKNQSKNTQNHTDIHAPFNLKTYLSDLICEQSRVVKPHKNTDTPSVNIRVPIHELLAHCKQCGMPDNFVNELKSCHDSDPFPHSYIDLKSIHQIGANHASDLQISLPNQAHTHCIIYHPKIGCMEFCKHCNKIRSTFCDNPSCLTKTSINNIVNTADLSLHNTQSVTKALRHLFHFYNSPYKDTTLFTDIYDLNQKYDPQKGNANSSAQSGAKEINIFSSLRSSMDLNKRLNLAIPQSTGPLAPHAILITKSHNKNSKIKARNRSSSSTSLPNKLSSDIVTETDNKSDESSHKKSAKSAQSNSFNRYKHSHNHRSNYQRHRSRHQQYRYRYNKRRAANFNKLKKGGNFKSEYTTHHVVCMTPSSVSYPESMHSYEEKGQSVPPMTPMIRANSAHQPHMSSINHGRPYGLHYTHNKVLANKMSYLDENVAKSERSFDEYSNAASVTPVHSVHNGLNPQWSNPYATGVIKPVMNDAASLSSLPMSPTFSYTSLPNFPVSPFVYSTSNMSHHSTSTDGRNSDLLPNVEVLNHQYSRLNHLLKCEESESKSKSGKKKESESAAVKVMSKDEIDLTMNYAQMNSAPVYPHLNMPMNLRNVNTNNGMAAPMQLKPPFIPLSTVHVPQYYAQSNVNTQMSALCQLPQNIQMQLRGAGLPQNALILPIDQMQSFKQLFEANKNHQTFMANLNKKKQNNFVGNNQNQNQTRNNTMNQNTMANNNNNQNMHRNARR